MPRQAVDMPSQSRTCAYLSTFLPSLFRLLGCFAEGVDCCVIFLLLDNGWFPFLSSTVTTVNRKKRKMAVEFRRTRYEGA